MLPPNRTPPGVKHPNCGNPPSTTLSPPPRSPLTMWAWHPHSRARSPLLDPLLLYPLLLYPLLLYPKPSPCPLWRQALPPASCLAIKQRIKSSHIPLVTGIRSSPQHSMHSFAVLHRTTNQSSAKCCLKFTTRGGHRMFLGLYGSRLPHPLVPVSHESCTLGLVSTLRRSLKLADPFLTLSPAS